MTSCTFDSILFIQLQRHAYVRYGKIPSLDSGEMLKSILIWVIPLTTFLLSMYVTAFTKDSLSWIVCAMGTMLHPLIAISLGIIVQNTIPLRYLKHFTMSIFFILININQVYLTYNWYTFREHKKLNMTEGENVREIGAFGKRFDQCGCDEDKYNCILEDETEKFNIITYTKKIANCETVPYFLISFITLQVLWYMLIELCRNEGIPILQFLLGPKEWLQTKEWFEINQGKSPFDKIGDCFSGIKKSIVQIEMQEKTIPLPSNNKTQSVPINEAGYSV